MNMTLAHIFFVLALICYVTAMFQKTRKTFLFVIILCDITFALYYLFLDRYTPMILNSVEGVLMVCLYFIEKHHKSHKYVLVSVAITWAVYVTATILTWTDPLQLLSLCASTMFLLGLVFGKLVITKALDIVSSTCATIYWFCVSSVFTGCVGICLTIGVVAGFLKTLFFDLKKREIQSEHAKTVEQKTVTKNYSAP